VINYDGRRFRALTDDGGEGPVAEWHQESDVVWGVFSGGHVRKGTLTGLCRRDGSLEFTYCMVLEGGRVICGRSFSVPDRLEDGRIRLTERFERYGPDAATGVSYLEEIAATTTRED